ncbi:MAG: efflux RND transporter periplasmic adaptor subunit [Pseudonocardia sp.]|nr:efflux RND transporter periplasmic adaptor subunit [Pseudonocardia sp.]
MSFDDQRVVVEVFRGTEKRWAVKRAAFVSLPLATAVVVASVVAMQGSSEWPMTLTAKVEEGQVSRMVTGKGSVSAAKTANLNFRAANNIRVVDVKIGDRVKKGQKLGEEENGGLRRAVLQTQQILAQQQAALDLILRDVNPEGLHRIFVRAEAVAHQAFQNIKLKEKADWDVVARQRHIVFLDIQAEDQAKQKLAADGCRPDGTPDTPIPTPLQVSTCNTDKAAVAAADLKRFNDTTTLINAKNAVRVDRGVLISTFRTARQAAVTAFNNWNVAITNRPNQILAQRALVANALVNVANAQGSLANSYIYAPVDGTISALAGTLGEFSAGGNNLTPNTPLAPGSLAKIPTVGPLAGADQKNLTGGQAPNLGLQAVLPGGQTFLQLSDLNSFQVVAAYPEVDAAKITPGSAAKVSFDALPGKDADGTVTSIAPIGTPGPNGVPTYYATVLLNNAPPELKSGLTANVSVVTSTVLNKAMVVPTSAVTEENDQSFVQVPGPDGTPQKKAFTRGAVGDDNSQVISGLNKGDTVLVPESGKLPKAHSDQAPTAPAEQALNFDSTPARPVAPAAPVPAVPGQPAPSAPPAPAAPPAPPATTYPGDPGDVAPEPVAADPSPGSSGSPPGGVNPFATPAATGSPGN